MATLNTFADNLYFGQQINHDNVMSSPWYVDAHPFSEFFFNDIEYLQMQIESCSVEHVIQRHSYQSMFARKLYAKTNNCYLKSIFDDTLSKQDIEAHIESTIMEPTYKVIKDIDAKGRTKYLVHKW